MIVDWWCAGTTSRLHSSLTIVVVERGGSRIQCFLLIKSDLLLLLFLYLITGCHWLATSAPLVVVIKCKCIQGVKIIKSPVEENSSFWPKVCKVSFGDNAREVQGDKILGRPGRCRQWKWRRCTGQERRTKPRWRGGLGEAVAATQLSWWVVGQYSAFEWDGETVSVLCRGNIVTALIIILTTGRRGSLFWSGTLWFRTAWIALLRREMEAKVWCMI